LHHKFCVFEFHTLYRRPEGATLAQLCSLHVLSAIHSDARLPRLCVAAAAPG
jgi:hypothetical protein